MINAAIERKWITPRQVQNIHDLVISPSGKLVADLKEAGITITPGKSICFQSSPTTQAIMESSRWKSTPELNRKTELHNGFAEYIQEIMRTEKDFGLFSVREHASSKGIAREYVINPHWKAEIKRYIG